MKYVRPNAEVVKRVLPRAILLVVAAHVLAVLADYYFDWIHFEFIRTIFDLDGEANVPATLSAVMLIMTAYLLWPLAKKKPKGKTKTIYIGLFAGFLFLGLDEFFIIHERTARPVRELFNIGESSLLYHAWVIPAGLVVLACIPLLRYLLKSKSADSKFQRKLILLFMALAIMVFGLEVIGTLYNTESPLVYSLVTVLIEELLELSMIGLILYTAAKKTGKKPRKKLS